MNTVVKTASAKGGITFRPRNSAEPPTDAWRASNCALARLLTARRPHLAAAVASARIIYREIDTLIASMTDLRRRTCRFCPEPCCITNTVWFDYRDLLLFHLLDGPLPARQATSERDEACPFLGHRGCRLPWHTRPWMCLKYICPTQHEILKKEGRLDPAALDGRIAAIENQRHQMETEVLDGIKPKNRTAPSSSAAYWP